MGYGKSLLEMSRLESGVLGNALEGVPEGGDIVGDPQFEDIENMTAEEKLEVDSKVKEALDFNTIPARWNGRRLRPLHWRPRVWRMKKPRRKVLTSLWRKILRLSRIRLTLHPPRKSLGTMRKILATSSRPGRCSSWPRLSTLSRWRLLPRTRRSSLAGGSARSSSTWVRCRLKTRIMIRLWRISISA